MFGYCDHRISSCVYHELELLQSVQPAQLNKEIENIWFKKMSHNWNSFCILRFFPFHFHFIFLQLLSNLSARFLSTKFLSFTRRGRHIPPHGNLLTATMTRVKASHWHSQLPEQFASSMVRRMTTKKGNLDLWSTQSQKSFYKTSFIIISGIQLTAVHSTYVQK